MDRDWQADRRALVETQNWVGPRLVVGNPADTLRSAELDSCLEDYPAAWLYGELNADQINELIVRRSALFANQPTNMEPQGRILFILANCDTAMGEGVPASDGVIDDAYLPPWDTWFAILELDPTLELIVPYILLAWIPQGLEAPTQNAMDVAASQHLGWLDEVWNNVTEAFELKTIQDNDPHGHLGRVLHRACRELA